MRVMWRNMAVGRYAPSRHLGSFYTPPPSGVKGISLNAERLPLEIPYRQVMSIGVEGTSPTITGATSSTKPSGRKVSADARNSSKVHQRISSIFSLVRFRNRRGGFAHAIK